MSNKIKSVSDYLNDKHKELIIRTCFMIAAFDCDIDKSEVEIINDLLFPWG